MTDYYTYRPGSPEEPTKKEGSAHLGWAETFSKKYKPGEPITREDLEVTWLEGWVQSAAIHSWRDQDIPKNDSSENTS